MARKRGMQFIPYDYEAAYNKAMEDMHEWFIENLFQHRKKVIYALKEITAGDQFEIEIYPQFRSMDEVPPEGRTIKKDNNKAQKNLNDKNARKYVERLINENFSDRDIWMTCNRIKMDAAYKKYTIAQSVKLNFIEKCSNMKVKHPKDYWLEYERKMLENINETTGL